MARRRAVVGPVVAAPPPVLLECLRRDGQTVERWVGPDEHEPYDRRTRVVGAGGDPREVADAEWRQITALRRWQAAVTEWGAEHGLDTRALRRMGHWPTYPPPPAVAAPPSS